MPTLYWIGEIQKPDTGPWCWCTSGVFDQGDILLGHTPASAKLLLQQSDIEKPNLRVVLTTSGVAFPFSLPAYLAFASASSAKRCQLWSLGI